LKGRRIRREEESEEKQEFELRKMKTLLLFLFAFIVFSEGAKIPNEEKCYDAEVLPKYCAAWKARGFCLNDELTRRYCQKTCGLCNTCYDAKIEDDIQSCKTWKEAGYCNPGEPVSQNSHTRASCQKTCGLCFKCYDAENEDKCKASKESGLCNERTYERTFCKKTCGFCS